MKIPIELKDNSIALRVWAIAKYYITETVLWSTTSVRMLPQIYGSTDGKIYQVHRLWDR